MTIQITKNLEKVVKATDAYMPLKDFEPKQWLENSDNIALCDERGNINLFQKEKDGIYYGHYFYFDRGKQAVKTAKESLEFVFKSLDFVDLIIGLTPHDNKGAMWMSRHLGFNSQGAMKIDNEDYEFFTLSKKEYLENE